MARPKITLPNCAGIYPGTDRMEQLAFIWNRIRTPWSAFEDHLVNCVGIYIRGNRPDITVGLHLEPKGNRIRTLWSASEDHL